MLLTLFHFVDAREISRYLFETASPETSPYFLEETFRHEEESTTVFVSYWLGQG